jgi:mRNA interferase MazF
MTAERGDVVVATDPFKDDTTGRPFLVINRTETPFYGEQYIACSLTTRTWHDERIPLVDEHWIDGGAPKSSSIMPWSVNSIKSEWISYRQGTLHEDIIDQAVAQLKKYIE